MIQEASAAVAAPADRARGPSKLPQRYRGSVIPNRARKIVQGIVRARRRPRLDVLPWDKEQSDPFRQLHRETSTECKRRSRVHRAIVRISRQASVCEPER